MPSPTTMRAFVYDRYGEPDALRIDEIARPTPGPGQVRVRVIASSINSADQRLLRAIPFLARLDNGLFRPKKRRVLGADVCGVVDAVGAGATRWAVGDEVLGQSMAMGCFAEAVCLAETDLARRPPSVSVEACAAAPLAGVTAIQAVRERARVQRGQRVLVMGAGGGVGTMLVQVAKAYGAHVTAMCGPKSAEIVRARGADDVLDHTRDAPPNDAFDVAFGVNGYQPLGRYLRWLKRGGMYVMVGGSNAQIFEALLLGKLRFLGSGRRSDVLTLDPALHGKDVAELAVMLDDGRLRPLVDRVVPMTELPAAMKAAWSGEAHGKIVLDARAFSRVSSSA
jgi:NADPH:quinone reductase-like Zn-dependent oxidoreductase